MRKRRAGRRRLRLEPLEPRLLLNASLVPGEFTYFDISGAGANNDVPDPGDLFVGLGSGTTPGVSIVLVESNLGNSAPTELRIQGTGGADTIEIFFNASPGVVLNYSGGSYALDVHHESVTWNSASGALSGNDSALSAGSYVAAGPGLAAAGADVVAGVSGDMPTFSLNRTAQGTLAQLSGQVVSHGAGGAGNFTTNAPVVNLTIDVNGSGSLSGAMGNVSAPSWNGGGISADAIGAITIATGDMAAGTFTSAGTIGNISVAGNLGADISAGGNTGTLAVGTAGTGNLSGTVAIGGTLPSASVSGTLSGSLTTAGTMGDLTLGAVGAGAVVQSGSSIGQVNVTGDLLGDLTAATTVGDISVGGSVGSDSDLSATNFSGFYTGGNYDGTLAGQNIGAIEVGGDAGGDFLIDGNIGQQVLIWGDFSGTLQATGGDIANVEIHGSVLYVDASTYGQILATRSQSNGGAIGNVDILGAFAGTISALGGDISSVEVWDAADATTATITAERLTGAGGTVNQVAIYGGGYGGLVQARGGDVVSFSAAGSLGADGVVRAINYLGAGGDVQSVTLGLDLLGLVEADGGDVATVDVGRDVGADAVIQADYLYTQGGSIGTVSVGEDMLGDILADWHDTNTTATIGTITIGGDLGQNGAPSLITAVEVDTIYVGADVPGETQVLPQVTSLTVVGDADDLWVWGEVQSLSVGSAGYLTIGGYHPHGSPSAAPTPQEEPELRWNAGSVQIGDPLYGYGELRDQLWVWGDVDTISIVNAAAQPGAVFVDGTVMNGVSVFGRSGAIHVGALAPGATIEVQGELAGGGIPAENAYIHLAGAIDPTFPSTWREGGGLDASNQIAVGNNEFRVFSLGSLADAPILHGDLYLTDEDWSDGSFFMVEDPAAGQLVPLYELTPRANPGAGLGGPDGMHYYDGGWVGWGHYTDGVYGNYYYRGFRIDPDNAAATSTGGPEVYRQEYLTFKDSYGGDQFGRNELPEVAFAISQGRVGEITITSSPEGTDWDNATGIESSTAILSDISATGNLSFLYVHGNEDYRGNVGSVAIALNDGGYGSLSGARLDLYDAASGSYLPYSTQTSPDDDLEHVVVATSTSYGDIPWGDVYLENQYPAGLSWNGILGIYARNGSIAQVEVEGDEAGDIVADFGGIDSVVVDADRPDRMAAYAAQTQPYVIGHKPDGLHEPGLDRVQFNFDQPMDTTSFDPATDIVSFTGPGGPVSVTGYGWLDADTLEVYFGALTDPGDYSLTLGTGLANQPGTFASLASAYTADFEIGTITDDWTFMVYLDADNNLEDAAVEDFLEMAAAPDSAQVNVVALFDRIDGYTSAYGDWAGARRGVVHNGDTPSAAWGTSLGELDMADPDTLVDFVQWATTNYPAQNYALVLWDHGSGCLGAIYDETSNGDVLEPREVADAMARAGQWLDVVGYDACLMGTLESATEFVGHASVFVGSQEVEPGDGWPYDTILADLVANPDWSAEDLAADIVAQYDISYSGENTLSAVRLSDLAGPGGLTAAIDTLATTIMADATEDDLQALASLRNDAAIFPSSSEYADLGLFLDGARSSANLSASIAAAAADAYTAYTTALIANHAGDPAPEATGLSVYFPARGDEIATDYNSWNLHFAQVTDWDDFLAPNSPTDLENWGWQDNQALGLYATIHARGPNGDIGQVAADAAWAYRNTDPADYLGGGARIIAEGNLGSSDPAAGWAVWVGQGEGTDGWGYVESIRAGSLGVRTTIHAEVNDLWALEITGSDGFRAEDRVELPYDNDLYLQVEGPLLWNPGDFNVAIATERDGVHEGLGDGDRADWSFPAPIPWRAWETSDVAVARRLTVADSAAYRHNIYFFNEGDIDAAPGVQSYDQDDQRIEHIEYVAVGGDATVDQYLYQGQLDRLELADGPSDTASGEGVAVLLTTKAYVPEGQPGFNYYGRILASGANLLAFVAEHDVREVRASNGMDIVGTPFGLTTSTPSFFTFTQGDWADWDSDGATGDPTAVLDLNGTVYKVYTAEAGSSLMGDVITQAGDIQTIDVTEGSGSDIDVASAQDILDLNIRDAGGTLSVLAAGDLHTIRTAGTIDIAQGGSVSADTLIQADTALGTVQITHGTWQDGDRVIVGTALGATDSDLFMTVADGFDTGSVAIYGPALDGAQPTYTLQNTERVGPAHYYYVSTDYAQADRLATDPPYAELELSNDTGADDEVELTFTGAAGVLNAIQVDESSQTGFAPPASVGRYLDITTGDRLSVLIVSSDPADPNVQPLLVDSLAVGGPNVYLAAAHASSFAFDPGDLALAAPDATPLNWSFSLSDATIFPTDQDGYNSLWYRAGPGDPLEVPIEITLPPGGGPFGLDIAADFDAYQGENGHLVQLAITSQGGVQAPNVGLAGADFAATTIVSDLDLLRIESQDLNLAGAPGGGLGGLQLAGDLSGTITLVADRPVGQVAIAGTLSVDLRAGEFTGPVSIGAMAGGAVLEATGGTLTSGNIPQVSIGSSLIDSRVVAAGDIGDVDVGGSLVLPTTQVGGSPQHDEPRIAAGGSIGDIALAGDLVVPFLLSGTGPIVSAEGGDIGDVSIGGNADAPFGQTTEAALQSAGNFGNIAILGPQAVLKVQGSGDAQSLSAPNGSLANVSLLGLGVSDGITANTIGTVFVEGVVGGNISAGSISSLEIAGLANQSVVEATAGDITNLVVHSALTPAEGHIVAAGNLGSVTVEGSLTGDPVELGPLATPVIEATSGDIGLVTVGSPAVGETLAGRFVAAGTVLGFDLDEVESVGSLLIEGDLGAAGLDTAGGVGLATLSVTGDALGPVRAADMPLPITIGGAVGAAVASEAAIARLTTTGLLAAGSIAAATDIGSLVITGDLTGGTISAGGGIATTAPVEIQGSMTGGTIRADGAAGIGDVSVGGDFAGGAIRATAGSLGDVQIAGNVTGGRIAAEGGNIATLTVGGDLAVPFNPDDPNDQPVVESSGTTGRVTITGDATGWLRAGGQGFTAGVRVEGDTQDLYLDGNLHAASPAAECLGAIQRLVVTGSLFGDISAGSTIQEVIIHGNLESDPPGGAVTVQAPIEFLYVAGSLPAALNVEGPALYLASTEDPSATSINIVQPVSTNPHAHSYVLTKDNFFVYDAVNDKGFNNFFYWRDGAPQPGQIAFTGTFSTQAQTDQAALDITIAKNGDWLPQNITVSPVNPYPLLVLSIQTNTDVGTIEVNGDAGTLTIDGGDGDADAILVHGHLDGLAANSVATLQVDNGAEHLNLGSMGLSGGLVELVWGGESHFVAPDALDDPSANGIPYDATFASQLTLSGPVVDLGGTDVYADITLNNVGQLLNVGGTFFGDIVSTGDVALIHASAFGTGGYTAGPDGDADFDNADGANSVVGTFDDVLLNAIQVNGDLQALMADEDIFAEINVTGDLNTAEAGGQIGGSITVGGNLGIWGASGESTLAHPETIELDGVHFSHDDALGGVLAGGDIYGPISAGGDITVIKAGGNIGIGLDWASDAYGALSRHLIQAGGDINAVKATGSVFARLSAGGALDYLIAGGNIESATRKDVIPQSGSATNQTASGDPLVNAADIGFIGAGGQVVGATTWRLPPGQLYQWTDEAGNQHELIVGGGTAALFNAYGNVVRIDFSSSNAYVYSNGDLGIVSARGRISVVTGAIRETRTITDPNTQQQTTTFTGRWLLPRVDGRSVYGLPTDPVYTCGVTAGVLAVESRTSHVSRVVSTGPVGSVVAHSGDVLRVDVLDNSLGLVVAGEEFTLARPDGQPRASVQAERNVGSIRVLRSTALLPQAEAQGQQYPGGADSWLLGSVVAGGSISRLNIENIAASTDIQAGLHVRNVQIIAGTGQVDMGLYYNFDRSQILAQAGYVYRVLVGATRGRTVTRVGDCLIDILGNRIYRVTVTGDLLSDIGSPQTTYIGTVESLSGSIGRRDLTLPADPNQQPMIPQVTSADRIRRIAALGDIYVQANANRIDYIIAENGQIGIVGQNDQTAINTTDRLYYVRAATGIGTPITTGGDLRTLRILGGTLTSPLNVGGMLGYLEAHGTPGQNTIAADITVGNRLRSLRVYDGTIAADITVQNGNLDYLRASNPGLVAIAGNVAVQNGRIGRLYAYGDITGNITTAAGLGSLYLGSTLAGDLAIAGNAGTIQLRGDLTGTITTTAIPGQNGDLRYLRVYGGRIVRPGQTAVTVAGDLRSLAITGYRGAEQNVVDANIAVAGQLRSATISGGDLAGTITAASMGTVRIYSPGGLTAPLTATAGGIRYLYVANGPIAADVNVAGTLSRLTARRGIAQGAAVNVTGDLTRLYSYGELAGTVEATGAISTLYLSGADLTGAVNAASLRSLVVRGGNAVGADLNLAGSLASAYLTGNLTNTTVEAGTIGRITVRGLISEDGSDGDTDEVHAAAGTFTIRDASWRGTITAAADHWFDGLRAWIG